MVLKYSRLSLKTSLGRSPPLVVSDSTQIPRPKSVGYTLLCDSLSDDRMLNTKAPRGGADFLSFSSSPLCSHATAHKRNNGRTKEKHIFRAEGACCRCIYHCPHHALSNRATFRGVVRGFTIFQVHQSSFVAVGSCYIFLARAMLHWTFSMTSQTIQVCQKAVTSSLAFELSRERETLSS